MYALNTGGGRSSRVQQTLSQLRVRSSERAPEKDGLINGAFSGVYHQKNIHTSSIILHI